MNDPNADLIGREFEGPGNYRYLVEKTAPWSKQYVYISSINHPEGVIPFDSSMNAALLRERLRRNP